MPTWTKLTKDDIKSTAKTFQGYIISTIDNDVNTVVSQTHLSALYKIKLLLSVFLLGQPSLKVVLILRNRLLCNYVNAHSLL